MEEDPGRGTYTKKRKIRVTGLLSDEDGPVSKRTKLDAADLQYKLQQVSKTQQKATSTTECDTEPPTPATPAKTDSGYASSLLSPDTALKTPRVIQPGSVDYISGIESDCGTPAISSSENTSVSKSCLHLHPERLQKYIQRNFVEIKNEADPSGVADRLFSKGVITSKDIELVKQRGIPRREKCDILLKAIVNSKLKANVNTTQIVLDAFEEEHSGHLFHNLKEAIPTLTYRWPNGKELEKVEIQRRFHKYEKEMDEVDPNEIIDDLLVKEVLTFIEHQNIKKDIQFKPDKMDGILKYVLRKQTTCFLGLCEVLKENAGYTAIADLLLNDSGPDTTSTLVRTDVFVVEIRPVNTPVTTHNNDAAGNDAEVILNLIGDGCREIEQMIVDNNETDTDLNEEAMEVGYAYTGMSYSSIRIKLNARSRQSQLELLRKSEISPNYLQKWLRQILTDAHMKAIQEATIDQMSFKIRINWPDDISIECSCKIRKENIVKNFTILEEEVRCISDILKEFSAFKGFDDKTQNEFLKMAKIETDNSKTEALLRKLLSGNGAELCLFERELRKTHQIDLLKRVTTESCEKKEQSLTRQDIRRNMTLLLEEIEPRHFINILHTMNASEQLIQNILSSDKRLSRCKAFLEYILKYGTKENNCFKTFTAELERLELHHLLSLVLPKEICQHNRTVDTTDVYEAIIASYNTLLNNIEPRSLRQIFVERKIIRAKRFDRLFCKGQRRRERASAFLKFLTKEPFSLDLMECFMDALRITGNDAVYRLITSKAEEYKECPRLHQSSIGMSSTLIEGIFELKVETEKQRQVRLQRLCNQQSKECRVDQPLTADKLRMVSEWVDKHQEYHTKRETEQKLAANDTNKLNKKIMSPVPSSSGVFTGETDSRSMFSDALCRTSSRDTKCGDTPAQHTALSDNDSEASTVLFDDVMAQQNIETVSRTVRKSFQLENECHSSPNEPCSTGEETTIPYPSCSDGTKSNIPTAVCTESFSQEARCINGPIAQVPVTCTASIAEQNEQPHNQYEDISPPPSPIRDTTDQPFVRFEPKYVGSLSIKEVRTFRRRHSLEDDSCMSSLPSSPASQIDISISPRRIPSLIPSLRTSPTFRKYVGKHHTNNPN